mmetsp:Transcript_32458/g.74996  ORF Transcript_32458/g.74996 Transcript_32458/m.74996 type:complete len:219 (+) Transcript_32458:1597-2253(+)
MSHQHVCAVARVRVSTLCQHLDSVDLLAQGTQNNDQERGVNRLHLAKISKTGGGELDHIHIYGTLDDSYIHVRWRLVRFLGFRHLCCMLAAMELQEPRNEIEQMQHVELCSSNGIRSLRTHPTALPHDAHKRAEVRGAQVLEELAITLKQLVRMVGPIVQGSANVRIKLVVLANRPFRKVNEEGIVKHVLLLSSSVSVAELSLEKRSTFWNYAVLEHR